MTVVGLVNGMVGSGCLVLPVICLTAGVFTTVWVCIVVGFICYYTCDLYVIHMGHAQNIKVAVLAHFKEDYFYFRFYGFFIWLSFVPFLLGYFRIVAIQINGLLGYNSEWTGPGLALFLVIVVTLIRYWRIG